MYGYFRLNKILLKIGIDNGYFNYFVILNYFR